MPLGVVMLEKKKSLDKNNDDFTLNILNHVFVCVCRFLRGAVVGRTAVLCHYFSLSSSLLFSVGLKEDTKRNFLYLSFFHRSV